MKIIINVAIIIIFVSLLILMFSIYTYKSITETESYDSNIKLNNI